MKSAWSYSRKLEASETKNMTDGPAISRYSHTQKAPLCLLIYALAVLFVALGWFVQDAPPIPWLFPPIGSLMLVLAASIHHLSVVDQGEEMAVFFGPVPLLRTTIPYCEIKSVESNSGKGVRNRFWTIWSVMSKDEIRRDKYFYRFKLRRLLSTSPCVLPVE
jgi:hypothetical protein